MKAEELIELLEERPFLPLRFHMSNGRTHDVRHPENAIVGEGVIALAVPQHGRELPRIRLISLNHINEVEAVPTGSNGASKGKSRSPKK
jgi:hypothetical protein